MWHFLKEDEQLLVTTFTSRYVLNGPGTHFVPPYHKATKRNATTLEARQYVRVRNTLTGEVRNEIGAKLLFLNAEETILEELKALTLRKGQYVRIIDEVTGEIRVEQGETAVYLEPTERLLSSIEDGIDIDDDHAVVVRSVTTGQLNLITEKQVFIPTPDQEVVELQEKIVLNRGEYIKLIDRRTGEIRVERGEQTFFRQPTEDIFRPVRKGISIDDETAVQTRSISTGQLNLITEPQVFIPDNDQIDIKVVKRIQLEDHETVVVRQKDGSYNFRHGTDSNRSFFLAPHTELVEFWWASGLAKDTRQLRLTKLDRRPKFMWYDFEVRTADNVELLLGITFFWQIVDVEKMVATTDDTTGDVCAHSRSMIIQAVSRTTLEDFLDSFNETVHDAVIDTDDPFYDARGVKLHAVEVRAIACKDPGTQHILNEIIQETTDRLNRLQKQESENEVRLRKIAGEIEAEQSRGQLLELQRQAMRVEALAEGEAESERVRAFFDGLGDMPADDKIAIYNTLRKHDALKAISEGDAQLYFTPNDVNLSIESK